MGGLHTADWGYMQIKSKLAASGRVPGLFAGQGLAQEGETPETPKVYFETGRSTIAADQQRALDTARVFSARAIRS